MINSLSTPGMVFGFSTLKYLAAKKCRHFVIFKYIFWMNSNKRQPEEQQLKAKKEIEKWQSLCKDRG